MKRKMDKILEYKIPGFCVDACGAYGIVVGAVYICCFINDEDGRYDVTVDTVDTNGDFAKNIEWESYDVPQDAVQCLRKMVRRHTPAACTANY